MREALKIAVKNAICFEYHLPHKEYGICQSCLTTNKDACFSNNNPTQISHIIYNGIIEYAVNQFEIDYNNLELEQRKAILTSIKYSDDSSSEEKLKYGFYGEVLFDLLLRAKLKTSVLIAKGYFYSPLEDSETKGFDAFHLIERNAKPELWFGEAKFHQSYRQAITQVLEKLHISLSDKYLRKNLMAILDQRSHRTSVNPDINNIISAWEQNPNINLVEEIKNRRISMIYPVFVAYEKLRRSDYQQNIQTCIDFIASEYTRLNITIPATFNYRIFFMILPLSEVKKIKEQVITWIESQEPLI